MTAIGLAYSSITSPVIVKIKGAEEYDKRRLERIIRATRELPAMKIPTAEVERLVESNPHVLKSSFAANVFGRAELSVVYREPVAAIQGTPYAVDAAGEVFVAPKDRQFPLEIESNVQLFQPILTLCDPSRLRGLAELAKNLQVKLPKLAGKLALLDGVRISFKSGGLVVVFGDAEKLPAKVAVLEKLLSSRPAILEGRWTINLVDPEHPTQKPATD